MDDKDSEKAKKGQTDDYGFGVEDELLSQYQAFMDKHAKRKAMIQTTWKDWKITKSTNKKQLKVFVHNGVPEEHRVSLWLVCSGAMKMKEANNMNFDSACYYAEFVEKNKKLQEKGKTLPSSPEIEKDLQRTFPGHEKTESADGQDKLRRVLETYSRRNKAVGYCQSMNFITAWALLQMEEEDAFWLLSSIVEDHCAGTWSKNMFSIQVDSEVLLDLLREKLPELHKHITKIRLSLLLVTTKWFMCLFVGALPSEATMRLWDYFFLEGTVYLFKAAVYILSQLEPDLLKTKDTMNFCRTLHSKTRSLFDWKHVAEAHHNKMTDITTEKIEELRTTHRMSLKNEITPEQLKALREESFSKGAYFFNPPSGAVEIFSALSSTYKSLGSKLVSWYGKGKENYNNYLARQQLQNAKTRNPTLFDLESSVQQAMLQILKKDFKSIPGLDFCLSGLGIRYYKDGKSFQGNFANARRDGFGLLLFPDGRVEYEGFWKNDKREGQGSQTDITGNTTYKGDWKNDEYNGRGSFKAPGVTYEGDWKNGQQEGKGIMLFGTGDRYEGDWKANKPDGKGVMSFVSGDKYEGDFKAGVQEGKGIMSFANGYRYEGSWKNNKQEGRGMMYFPNGDRYDGDWKNTKIDGKGTMYFFNGEKYDGDWKNDKREGNGTMIFMDNSIYEGEWKNNKIEGKGTMLFVTSDKYVGEFKNQKPEGKGTMYYGNADIYDGDFKAGKRFGIGKITFYANGDSYEGEWKYDKMNGKGTYVNADGRKFTGDFEDGYRMVNGTKFHANGNSLGASTEEERSEFGVVKSDFSSTIKDKISQTANVSSRGGSFIGKRGALGSAIEDIRRKNN